MAHLTCSILTVGHMTATFTKDSSVDVEKLLRLRLRDGGTGVRIPTMVCKVGDLGQERSWPGQGAGRLLTQASGAAAGAGGPPRCSAAPGP